MRRPRKVESYPEADYPTLARYGVSRRRFLRGLAAGVAAGLGAGLFARCTSTSGITGSPGPSPEVFTVRLPGEGWATAYLMEWDYLTYGATFTTHDELFAAYFTGSPELGLGAMAAVLSSRYCSDLFDESRRAAVLADLQAALEAHYRESTGDVGTWILTFQMTVDSCEEMAVAGDMEVPPYP